MFSSMFSSRAHPLGSVALDSPAGGQNDALTPEEQAALAKVAGAAAQGIVAGIAPSGAASAEKPERSPLLLVGAVVGLVAIVWVVRRKG